MNNLSNRLYYAMKRPLLRTSKISTTNHPSSASVVIHNNGLKITYGGCLRAEYYRKKNYHQHGVENPDWQISAMLGEKYQEVLEHLFDRNSIRMGLQKVDIEYQISDVEHNLSGRVDMLYWDLVTSSLVGVEVKSVGQWKAGKTVKSPAIEHVLQSMIYLDWFRKNFNENQVPGWYIMYMARSESWNLKKREHGSPFIGLWDFFIKLNDKGQPVIKSANKVETLDYISLDMIYDRMDKSTEFFNNDIEPDRDYDLQYTEEKIASLYKLGLIPFKKDVTKIEKWLSNGAKPGELDLVLGDFECSACPFKHKCWELEEPEITRSLVDLPVVDRTPTPVKKELKLL